MTREQAPFPSPGLADAGAEVAQLQRLLALVDELAGGSVADEDDALDQAARISAAYDMALPIDQSRFDARAGEAARWAAAGAETLLALEEKSLPCRPAARALAVSLRRALAALEQIVLA